MSVILEKHGFKRYTLDLEIIEPFTQKPFVNLIRDQKVIRHDYFICLITNDDTSMGCYDARHACRYIFEIVISPDCRKIRIKNFKDPMTHKKIKDVTFYRMRYDSDTPLRAEFMGTHTDFLDSNCFRSKLFYKEDPLYTLSVNFNFQEVKGIPVFGRRQVFSLFITVMFILLIGTFIVLVLEKEKGFFMTKKIGATMKKVKVKPEFIHKLNKLL